MVTEENGVDLRWISAIRALEGFADLADNWDGAGSPAPLPLQVEAAVLGAREIRDQGAHSPTIIGVTMEGDIRMVWLNPPPDFESVWKEIEVVFRRAGSVVLIVTEPTGYRHEQAWDPDGSFRSLYENDRSGPRED